MTQAAWLARILAVPNESTAKTLAVGFAVALFGSILVTSASLTLRPRIEANLDAERQANLDAIVRQLPGIEELLAGVEAGAVEPFLVDLATGAFEPFDDPTDAEAVQGEGGLAIPPDKDIAGLKTIGPGEIVYLFRSKGELHLIVLPIRGQGYASTLYGYIGLSGDVNTVVGLAFYRHGETPGLGALIDTPGWRAKWRGKRVRDEQGRLRIGVAEGALPPGDPDVPYQVDGLTGATYTSRGVNNIVRFWLGDDGFGPFLARLQGQLRNGDVNEQQ